MNYPPKILKRNSRNGHKHLREKNNKQNLHKKYQKYRKKFENQTRALQKKYHIKPDVKNEFLESDTSILTDSTNSSDSSNARNFEKFKGKGRDK